LQDIITYDEHGIVMKQVKYQYDEKDQAEESVFTSINRYSDDGHLLERVINQSLLGNQQYYYSSCEYIIEKYDKKQHLISIENGNSVSCYPPDQSTFIYNHQGRLVHESYWSCFAYFFEISYSYSDNGRQREGHHYTDQEHFGEKKTLTEISRSVLDANGRALAVIIYDAKGNYIEKTYYRYDTKGNKVRETSFDLHRELSEQYNYEYLYDPQDNWTELTVSRLDADKQAFVPQMKHYRTITYRSQSTSSDRPVQ